MSIEFEKKDGDSGAAELLAELTGRPKEDFTAEDYEYPSLDQLERVPTDEEEE